MYLAKTDPDGSEEWSRAFGGSDSDQAYSVQQTADGGYIIVGSSSSFGEGTDIYVVKTDAGGNEEWHGTYGGSSFDRARSVQQTDDGGYVVAGYTFPLRERHSDAYLIKVDARGEEVWSRLFGMSGVDEAAFSVNLTADGGYIIAGFATRSQDRHNSDAYLVKTDADGNEEWSRTYGGAYADEVNSVGQTSDGGYILAGSTPAFGRGPLYVIRTDADGDEEWSVTLGDHTKGGAESVQQTRDGGYVVTGFTTHAYLIKLDADGNEEWSRRF